MKTFEENKYEIFNNGGFYFPIKISNLREPDFWSYVLAHLEHYDDVVFEYKEDGMEVGISSFDYKEMKSSFIKMGYMREINKNFIWKQNEDMPVGTMFIYERGKVRIMLEINLDAFTSIKAFSGGISTMEETKTIE